MQFNHNFILFCRGSCVHMLVNTFQLKNYHWLQAVGGVNQAVVQKRLGWHCGALRHAYLLEVHCLCTFPVKPAASIQVGSLACATSTVIL